MNITPENIVGKKVKYKDDNEIITVTSIKPYRHIFNDPSVNTKGLFHINNSIRVFKLEDLKEIVD